MTFRSEANAMLDTIQKLKKTITDEQRQSLESILKDVYPVFAKALESSSEDDAKSSVAEFTACLRRAPLKALKLNRMLTKEQKSLVYDLMPDDDDDDDEED